MFYLTPPATDLYRFSHTLSGLWRSLQLHAEDMLIKVQMAASTSFQPGFHSGTCPVRYAVKVNILRMSSNFAFCLVSCGIFCSTSRCAEKKNCSFTALTEGKCFVGEGKPRTGEPRGKGPTKTGLGTGGGSGIDRHTGGYSSGVEGGVTPAPKGFLSRGQLPVPRSTLD